MWVAQGVGLPPQHRPRQSSLSLAARSAFAFGPDEKHCGDMFAIEPDRTGADSGHVRFSATVFQVDALPIDFPLPVGHATLNDPVSVSSTDWTRSRRA